jgi:phosphate starvation-inducible membrane PsiE
MHRQWEKSSKIMIEWAKRMHAQLHEGAETIGNLLMESFHLITLFLIAIAVFWSTGVAFVEILSKGHATIDDILLLFIYLELGAMVGIYFKTNHMPVRFLIYVAITALTRLLIGDIQHHHKPTLGIIWVALATVLFALSTLVIRYGSAAFPSAKGRDGDK